MINNSSLKKLINIRGREVITIVGAGGKTSFMLYLASELKQYGKVAVTTTTKIYPPEDEDFDYMYIGDGKSILQSQYNNNGVYVIGSSINDDGKITSVKESLIVELSKMLDYVLIEGDGSKRKPLKGWRCDEPLVPSITTKTVGIIDIQSVGLEICEDNIHRCSIFTSMTNSKNGEKVTVEHLKKIINYPKGLFRYAEGEKVLFINKAEYDESYKNAMKLAQILMDNENINRIIVGSIKDRNYTLIK